MPLNRVQKRKNSSITIFFFTSDKIYFAFIRFSATKYMEIKFQEFLTFGICEKLSKNGRFSRYNLGKFVIFENWLVNWIMLNYISYLIYFVKIEIKRSSSQKKKFIGWKRARRWLVNSPSYINRNIKKLWNFSIGNKLPMY